MEKAEEVKLNAAMQKLDQLSKRTIMKDYIHLQGAWQNAIVKQEVMATMMYMNNPMHPIFDIQNDFFGAEQIKSIEDNVKCGKFDLIFKNIRFTK